MPSIEHTLNLLEPIMPWLIAFSVITLLISVIAVPWVVTVVPADYFTHRSRRRMHRRSGNSPLLWLWFVGKNVLGGILVILGVIMLVAPGQGVLTILIGLGIADFPGKYHLERRLIGLPGVLRTVNWIRRRHARPPLEVPSRADSARSRHARPDPQKRL